MSQAKTNMLSGPLAGSMLLYTLPIVCTSVLQLLFNAADLIVVGQYCGSVSVAAVGATGALTTLIVNLFVGLSVGAGVAVAHAIGSREEEVLRRTVHTAFPAALVSGVFLTAFGVALSKWFLILMGTPEDVLPLSTVYMRIYFAGITFTMVYNFCSSILRAAGDTRSPLILLGIAGVANVIMNVIFVRNFGMNVAGVALATVISQAFSAVGVTVVLMRRKDGCALRLGQIRFYRSELLKMIRIGLPAGIQGSMFSISNVIIQSSINSFGAAAMSGNAAAGNLDGFCFVTVDAFHQAAVNYTGQNVGARQYDRVRRIFWLSIVYGALAGLIMGGLAYLFRYQLLGIYITDSQEAIELGAQRMLITTAPYFLFGIMDVTTGVLRGMGASLSSMLISVLGVCGVRLLWVATAFAANRTAMCLYLSYPISWVVTAVVQFVAYAVVYKRQSAEETHSPASSV